MSLGWCILIRGGWRWPDVQNLQSHHPFLLVSSGGPSGLQPGWNIWGFILMPDLCFWPSWKHYFFCLVGALSLVSFDPNNFVTEWLSLHLTARPAVPRESFNIEEKIVVFLWRTWWGRRRVQIPHRKAFSTLFPQLLFLNILTSNSFQEEKNTPHVEILEFSIGFCSALNKSGSKKHYCISEIFLE